MSMTLEMTLEKALAALTARDNEHSNAGATIRSQTQVIAARTEEVACKDHQIASLKRDNACLSRQVEWFERQLFDTKSEKRMFDNPEQGADMFEASGVESGSTASPSSDDDQAGLCRSGGREEEKEDAPAGQEEPGQCRQ